MKEAISPHLRPSGPEQTLATAKAQPPPYQPGARGHPSCTAPVVPGMDQKAEPRALSRCTKGHIDRFVEAFPGVLYISLPRHP